MSVQLPPRGVGASGDEGASKRRWGSFRRQTSAERCAQAIEGGDLRRVLETDGLVLCAVTSAPISENSVAYRIVVDGFEMYGTILLTAADAGHFDAAFGAGCLPASGDFGSFQELFAKLSNIFHKARLARRRMGLW